MTPEFSDECKEALRLLSVSRNVLISGPPGTGKSRLLSEVALAFAKGAPAAAGGGPPVHKPVGGVPIPPAPAASDPALIKLMPSAGKTERAVFRCVFHQNSKHRDFLSGIAPTIVRKVGDADFRIVKGTLYRASEHAKKGSAAALVIIDEINRGPAVQIFGGAIVAIEADKRLNPDGSQHGETQYFELMDPDSGDIVEYALPHDLYILAAMNQADASVEPLDVAFLRRWEPMRLEPNVAALRRYYGLQLYNGALPEEAETPKDVYEASVRAWMAVNAQIALGRGHQFAIGHGVLMPSTDPKALSLHEAKELACLGWAKVITHVEEVFFGDVRGTAATLNALEGPAFNPFKLVETTFADDLRFRLEGPSALSATNVYPLLRAVAELAS